MGATTVLVAKMAFASAALAAAAFLWRVAVPQIVSCANSFRWKLYLFGTVHVIIFVIWKLSDNDKHSHAQQQKDPWAPTPHHRTTPLLTEELVLAAMRCKVQFVPPPVLRPHIEPVASKVNEAVVSPGSCGGE